MEMFLVWVDWKCVSYSIVLQRKQINYTNLYISLYLRLLVSSCESARRPITNQHTRWRLGFLLLTQYETTLRYWCSTS